MRLVETKSWIPKSLKKKNHVNNYEKYYVTNISHQNLAVSYWLILMGKKVVHLLHFYWSFCQSQQNEKKRSRKRQCLPPFR